MIRTRVQVRRQVQVRVQKNRTRTAALEQIVPPQPIRRESSSSNTSRESGERH
jgi:hypothetical protein